MKPNKKDKKKKFYGNNNNNHNHDKDYYNNPVTGYLVTSDQHREKNAVKDAYNFLNKQIDIHYQRQIERAIEEHLEKKKKVKTEKESTENKEAEKTEEKPETNKHEESLQKKLEEELQNYQKDTRVFYNLDTKCKGVIFIKINPIFQDIIDVKKIANTILTDVRENKNPVSRLIPVEIACRADFNIFKEKITPILQKKFNPEIPKKWVLHYKCRNNNKFHMKEFLEYIIEIVGRNHSVDYKNPDYTIFIEINNQMMCLSILKKFSRFKGYSLNIEQPSQHKDSNKQEEKKESQKKETVNQEDKINLITQDLEFEENQLEKENEDERKPLKDDDEDDNQNNNEDAKSEESIDIF